MKLAATLQADAATLREKFLALKNPRELAALLEVPYSVMVYHVYQKARALQYHRFEIPKRRGGMREIMAPTKSLKIMQSKLNAILSEVYRPKPSVHGFVKGRTVVTNAKPHCGRRLILNIDLKDFFPSINFGRVRGLFLGKPYQLPAPVATAVAKICCSDNQLPQGAPTSPIVSNMICHRLDTQLQMLAQRHGCHYSRYADDITISTFRSQFSIQLCAQVDGAVRLGSELQEIISSNGFVVNDEKVHVQRWDSRQEVTGLIVNRKPNVPRRYVRQIRAMIHALRKHGLPAAAQEHFRYRHGRLPESGDVVVPYSKVIRGKLAYLAMVRGKDSLYERLMADLNRLLASGEAEAEKSTVVSNVKIFISHTSKDLAVATALVDLLEACLETYDGAIRCTSVEGYKLNPGSDANETLRKNLEQCAVVIGLLTSESLLSGYVIMELGAAWGLRKVTCPLLAPDVSFERLPGPLKTTHGIKFTNPADLTQLVEVVGESAALKLRGRPKMTAAIQAFVAVVEAARAQAT